MHARALVVWATLRMGVNEPGAKDFSAAHRLPPLLGLELI
jgi:hypothetical protein